MPVDSHNFYDVCTAMMESYITTCGAHPGYAWLFSFVWSTKWVHSSALNVVGIALWSGNLAEFSIQEAGH